MELLRVRGIRKYFPETGVLANDGLSLALATGEIRAVVGENGAGKSTLAKILAGLLRPDSGEILIRGRQLRLGSVRAAEAAGLGYVPQHSLLAPGLTVAENLVLGHEPRRAGLFLDRRRAYIDAALLVERFGFRLDPGLRVRELSPAERREAEIARALARGGQLLVMDEPTSILAESESADLFALLRRLASDGKGIIFITHRLAEVLGVADTVTVLREGRVVADRVAAGCDEGELSSLMKRGGMDGAPAGGQVRGPAGGQARGTGAWEVRGAGPDFGAENGNGSPGIGDPPASRRQAGTGAGKPLTYELRDVRLRPEAQPFSISVRSGELLGVAALAGNGLDRLEDVLAGMHRPFTGTVLLDGRELHDIPRDELRSGLLAYVPSDRDSLGLCLHASLRDNGVVLSRGELPRSAWLLPSRRDRVVRRLFGTLGPRASLLAKASSLSGGNRQRLVLARELGGAHRAALLAEPFQGLDLESQAEAMRLVRARVHDGMAIIMLGSSLEELLPLVDRIAILYRGSLVHEGPNEGGRSAHALLASMTGVKTAGGTA